MEEKKVKQVLANELDENVKKQKLSEEELDQVAGGVPLISEIRK